MWKYCVHFYYLIGIDALPLSALKTFIFFQQALGGTARFYPYKHFIQGFIFVFSIKEFFCNPNCILTSV